MEKVQNVLYQLQNSVNSHKIDFELLERLKSEIDTKKMQSDNFQQQIKLLLHIYDLSNNEKLYTVRKASISMNQMAVQLKILVCQLMSTVILYFERQQSITLIPIQFLAEGIEIMVLSTRVCLNEGHTKFISQLQQFYKFIHSPFEYVLQFLPKNIQFFHQLNTIELIKYKCENQSFTIVDFQKRLALLSFYQETQNSEYQQFVSNIVMEIILKSLKNGKISSQKIQSLLLYLTDQNRKDLQSLIVATGNSTKNLQTSSQFLEIYNQIKNYGIENISMDFLEQFMKKQKNFNDERMFQIAALTLEPEFLEIWFNILNGKKEKSLLLEKAFMCYIHLVQSILGQCESQKQKSLSKLLKLSNTIIFTLLTEKKSNNSQQPILNIIKTLMKVLTQLCFSYNFQWKVINDFGERIVLICSRFQCMQISKVIYTLLLYCSLVKKHKAQDIYEKFLAYYKNEQSTQVFKVLSSAYLVQNSHQLNLNLQQMKNLQMFRKSFIMVLFAQNEEDMIIFEIDLKEFEQINNIFLVYVEMIKKYQDNQVNLTKILQHLENFLLKTKLDELNKIIQNSRQQKSNLKNLLLFLVELLQQKETANFKIIKNPSLFNKINEVQQGSSEKKEENSYDEKSIKICFILINLMIVSNPFILGELKQTSGGVLLNKYSQKVKLINGLIELIKKSKNQIETQLHNVCCCYLIIVLEKFKKSFIKKQRIGQPGQISFIHAISELVNINMELIFYQNHMEIGNQTNTKKMQKSRLNQSPQNIRNTFISFIIFQIDCLTNNHQKYIKKVDQMQISQLRTYMHSMYIPKLLKQKILRRIVKQNLMQKGSNVTLRQFKEIIEITQDPEELQLYMKFVFCSFGEQGRKMLMLISHENKRLQRILLNDNEIET